MTTSTNAECARVSLQIRVSLSPPTSLPLSPPSNLPAAPIGRIQIRSQNRWQDSRETQPPKRGCVSYCAPGYFYFFFKCAVATGSE